MTDTRVFSIEANADRVGLAAAGIVGTAVAAHAVASVYKRVRKPGEFGDHSGSDQTKTKTGEPS